MSTSTGLVLGMIEVDPIACVDRRVPQLRLVLLDAEDVAAFLSDDEPCRFPLGVQRICGDHPTCEVDRLEQRSEGEDLVRLVVLDVALPDHHPGVMTKRCEQLDLGAVSSLRSPDRLAVNSHSDQLRSWLGAVILVRVVGVDRVDRSVADLGVCNVGRTGVGDLRSACSAAQVLTMRSNSSGSTAIAARRIVA